MLAFYSSRGKYSIFIQKEASEFYFFMSE